MIRMNFTVNTYLAETPSDKLRQLASEIHDQQPLVRVPVHVDVARLLHARTPLHAEYPKAFPKSRMMEKFHALHRMTRGPSWRSTELMSLATSEAAYWMATFLDLCIRIPRLGKSIRRRNDGPQFGTCEG